MAASTSPFRNAALLLLLPAVLLAVQGIYLVSRVGWARSAVEIVPPDTVALAPRSFAYRLPGEYLRNGKPVDAPSQDTRIDPDFVAMAHPVSVADYALCVADGACDKADGIAKAANLPVTGVSFDDAEAYAQWLTKTTGQAWRLPTDAEWAFFAGSRFTDDALGLDDDGANPADRWLAAYQREVELSGEGPMLPQPIGSQGVNEFGIGDLSGAVWEWTQTCYARVTVDTVGRELTRIDSCGVRIVEGRHRAAMSGFIRDARSGGCTSGLPPDNLGFRLVRDTGWQSAFRVWTTRLFS